MGDVAAGVTVSFEGLSPVRWTWSKKCGGKDNKGLMVTGGFHNDKAVVQGRARWDESYVVGTDAAKTKFALFLDPLSEESSLRISTPEARGRGSCSARVTSPITPGTVISSGVAAAAAVHYECNRHGPCIVDVEVPFDPPMAPFRPTRWSYTKLCGGTQLGVDVEADTAGKKTEIATDGAQVSGPDAVELFVDPEVNDHKVYVVNDKARSDEEEVKVQQLRVSCLDSLRCGASIKGEVPRLLSSSKATELDVGYSCRTSGSSVVQLFIETEGHDPIKLHWTKDCSVWTDSFPGVMLQAFISCLILSCSCVGCCHMCSVKGEWDESYAEGEYEGEEEE
jgi:hypothetical protein